MLPLDLHVLGLPLAFILSQDQTLRCIKLFFSDFQGYNVCFLRLVLAVKICSNIVGKITSAKVDF